MQLHNLTKNKSNKTAIRIGRGGKRGKTSGHGHKGQNARAGTSKRPEMRDTIKKFPKLRGHGIHGNRPRALMVEHVAINLSDLEKAYAAGDTVDKTTLLEKGLLKRRLGKVLPAKILGTGELKKKLTVSGLPISKTAQAKIEVAGGSVTQSQVK